MNRYGTLLSLLLALVAGCTDPNGLWGFGRPGEPPEPFPGGRPAGPQPSFGQTITQANPPPAVSGGTLLVTRDGKTAIASDPDRDRVYVVDLEGASVSAEIALEANDEPGRVVQDDLGNVHVVLRRGGAVVSIDPVKGELLGRRAVCAAPRGIDFDAEARALYVACAGGELITLPMAGGAPTRTLRFERDLRDVVVAGQRIYVSRFRSAEILVLARDSGKLISTRRPRGTSRPGPRGDTQIDFEPQVGWRMTSDGAGGVYFVHQRGQSGAGEPVSTEEPGGYGSAGDPCGGIVHAAVTHLGASGAMTSSPAYGDLVLPVDIASAPGEEGVAVVAAGNSKMPFGTQVALMPGGSMGDIGPCGFAPPLPMDPMGPQPIAVQFAPNHRVVVQTREPAQLIVVDQGGWGGTREPIRLSRESRADTGHDVFHSNSGAGLACASCHPEGGDDGHTWVFHPIGPRRTQTLRGGILQTAPFHWDGDLSSMDKLFAEVMVKRMSGPDLEADKVGALAAWLDKLPTLPRSDVKNPAAAERGRVLYYDPAGANCGGCHDGARLTNNQSADVGTGGRFQVPTLLNIADRAPFIHDGCAKTLADRFGRCGGGDAHGKTSHLSPAQLADLVTFVETL